MEKGYRLQDFDVNTITRALREKCMTDLDAMKEACWENVHGGADWEPIAEGFLKGIVPCLRVHDAILTQKAAQESDVQRVRTIGEKGGGDVVREYMNTILDELKQATREHERPALRVIK